MRHCSGRFGVDTHRFAARHSHNHCFAIAAGCDTQRERPCNVWTGLTIDGRGLSIDWCLCAGAPPMMWCRELNPRTVRGQTVVAPTHATECPSECPNRVTSCLRDHVGITTGVLPIAADLLQRPSRHGEKPADLRDAGEFLTKGSLGVVTRSKSVVSRLVRSMICGRGCEQTEGPRGGYLRGPVGTSNALILKERKRMSGAIVRRGRGGNGAGGIDISYPDTD